MRTPIWALPATIALALLAQAAGAAPAADVGRAIYLEGRGASGAPLEGRLHNGSVLRGAAAACVNCHRRSGLGGSEGQSNVRPLAGAGRARTAVSRVFPGVARPRAPEYTPASLARALGSGADPGGRPFDALMPRYALSDDEAAHLHRYLDSLAGDAPGVDDREIHFATVVAPDAPPESRQAMLDVLRAYFADKNAGTRREAARRDGRNAGMYRAHRAWVLHEWTLEGPPVSWRAQLDAAYRRQPVFAVIGGLGRGPWAPVHGFCEDTEVPCVFPDVDHPGGEGTGHYTLYLSRGVALEADVLARQLADKGGGARIAQVYRDTDGGRAAARALDVALQARGMTAVRHPVDAAGTPPAAFWETVVATSRPTVLVVWLDGAELVNLGAVRPGDAADVYLSASLAATEPPELPAAWQGKLRVVFPFVLPEARAQRLARLTSWLAAKNMTLYAERAQANAFFAVTVAADAVAHLGGLFSREYFIERVEQMAGNPATPSLYPHPSLGPGQRYASRGAYILSLPGEGADGARPYRDWTIP